MPESSTQSLFREAADWDLFDVNVRLGSSGINGQLALDADGLLAEMKQFHIRRALVSHWETEEYDAALGNDTLARHASTTSGGAFAGSFITPSSSSSSRSSRPAAFASARRTPGTRRDAASRTSTTTYRTPWSGAS